MSVWLIETLFATTLLMVVVLVLRAPTRRVFGSGAAYALWLVPALRLPFANLDLFAAKPDLQVLPQAAAAFGVAPATANGVPWLLMIWAMGSAIFVGWNVLGYHRFLAVALSGSRNVRREIGIDVVASSGVGGPVAAGLVRRRIFVPDDFDVRFDAAERALALRHESVHHARGDLWANAAALGMLALHWWNPLAHHAYRTFRADQELACDAAVIGDAGPPQRHAYGRAMVKSASGARAAPLTCPMTRPNHLKRRLAMIKTHKTSIVKRIFGMAGVGFAALAGLALTATGGMAAPAAVVKTIVIERTTSMENADGAIKAALDGRCVDAAQVAEAQKRLRTALEASIGKPVRAVTLSCGLKDKTPAERAESLEKGLEAVRTSDQFKPEQRARIITALEEAITKAKAGE